MFHIDTSTWSDQAKKFLRATGRSARDVLRSEGKLFVLDCAKFTPPTGRHPSQESLNVQRRSGENAIAKDIRRVFLDPMQLNIVKKSPALAEELRKYLAGSVPRSRLPKNQIGRILAGARTSRQDAMDCAITVLRRIGVRVPIVLEATEALHKSTRDGRGRTRPNRAMMVLRPKSIERLIRTVQKQVGREKSGWSTPAAALGAKLPAWITRHGSAGLFREDTSDNPSITIGNLVTYAQEHGARLRIIQRALDRRVDSLKRRLERIEGK